MYPLTDAQLAAMARDHSRTTYAEVYRNNQRVIKRDQLNVIQGTIDIDGTAAVRRRLDLILAIDDPSLMPVSATDGLAPFGNEMRVFHFYQFDNGDQLTIPLGVFRISEPKGTDSAAGVQLEITGYDRSRTVSRARLSVPYTQQAGVNFALAIQALVNSRLSGLAWALMATSHTTPPFVLPIQTDAWDQATKMALGIGGLLFFDQSGNPILQAQPDPATQIPVASFIEGPTATAIEFDPDLTDDPGYNGVVVTGQPSQGSPVRSVAWDDNEQSPTFYKGPYNEVPTFITSQYIASQPQANDASKAGLLQVLGIPETVSFKAIPNGALDAGDVIRLRRAQSRIDDIYVITSISMPLTHDQLMTVTARRRKTL